MLIWCCFGFDDVFVLIKFWMNNHYELRCCDESKLNEWLSWTEFEFEFDLMMIMKKMIFALMMCSIIQHLLVCFVWPDFVVLKTDSLFFVSLFILDFECWFCLTCMNLQISNLKSQISSQPIIKFNKLNLESWFFNLESF